MITNRLAKPIDVTKDMVLEALETEPLMFGQWANRSYDGVCTYCAIGSIIVHHAPKTSILMDTIGLANRAANGEFHHAIAPMDMPNSADSDYTPIADTPQNFYEYDDEAPKLLPQSWPAALSFVWESLGELNGGDTDITGGMSIEEARTHMIDWVEDNVPEDEVLFVIGV